MGQTGGMKGGAAVTGGSPGYGLPGHAVRSRQETSQRLEQKGERDGGQQVRLAQVERREPEIGPQLAESEAGRRGDEHRDVSAPAVAERRVEDLRRYEHQENRDDDARGDESSSVQSASSGTRGWVVLSKLRWVPCLGFPGPVEQASGRLSGLRGPECCRPLGSPRRSRGRRRRRARWEADPCYEGFVGGTTRICSSSSSAGSAALGAPSMRS